MGKWLCRLVWRLQNYFSLLFCIYLKRKVAGLIQYSQFQSHTVYVNYFKGFFQVPGPAGIGDIVSLEDKHFLYHVKKLVQQKKINTKETLPIQLSFTVHKLRNGH